MVRSPQLFSESSQKIQMMLAPGDDVIEIIPRGAYSVA